ncbi:hypothetical protein [Ideonella sp.]|uniref:hypothetical protein n=1 Tax=Ideonella sp. TaxID=1929293 RepID=UPI0035B34F7B
MSVIRRFRSPRPMAAAGMACCLWLGAWALPAGAETLTWRQTSVQAGSEGRSALRRGVVIFGTGEPALMTVRLTPLAPPQDGQMTVQNDFNYRFEDGSTLVLQARTVVRVTPEGRAARGEYQAEGQVLSGTGRYQGATGRFKMRSRTDLDALADGALGDYFAACEADIQLPK